MSEYPKLLQLDMAGNPTKWATYEEGAYYYAKGLVAWSAGDSDVTLRGGNNSVTGKLSTLNINTIFAVRGHMNDKGVNKTPPLSNEALFRRDHCICAYCGNHLEDRLLTRDHVIPTSKGGLNKWSNVVTACGRCNKYKDDQLLENSGLKLLYVPYVPNYSEYLLLMNRKVLADQMTFLKAKIPATSRVHAINLHESLKVTH